MNKTTNEPVAKVDSRFDSQVVWYLDQLPKDGTKLYTRPQDQKKDEALRLALEALKVAFDQTCSVGRAKDWNQIKEAITLIEQALENK